MGDVGSDSFSSSMEEDEVDLGVVGSVSVTDEWLCCCCFFFFFFFLLVFSCDMFSSGLSLEKSLEEESVDLVTIVLSSLILGTLVLSGASGFLSCAARESARSPVPEEEGDDVLEEEEEEEEEEGEEEEPLVLLLLFVPVEVVEGDCTETTEGDDETKRLLP